MVEKQLQEDCDCHNFCNDEWIGCVAFGEESSEFMCDQSQLVACCAADDILDKLPHHQCQPSNLCSVAAILRRKSVDYRNRLEIISWVILFG
jgi:hypothetical protein